MLVRMMMEQARRLSLLAFRAIRIDFIAASRRRGDEPQADDGRAQRLTNSHRKLLFLATGTRTLPNRSGDRSIPYPAQVVCSPQSTTRATDSTVGRERRFRHYHHSSDNSPRGLRKTAQLNTNVNFIPLLTRSPVASTITAFDRIERGDMPPDVGSIKFVSVDPTPDSQEPAMRRTLRDFAILAVFLGLAQGSAVRGFAAEIGASDPHRCACGMNCGSVCCCSHQHSVSIARPKPIEGVDPAAIKQAREPADRFSAHRFADSEPIDSQTNPDSACMSSLPCGRGAPFSPAVGGSTRVFEPAATPVLIVYSADEGGRTLVVPGGRVSPRHASIPLEKPPKTPSI